MYFGRVGWDGGVSLKPWPNGLASRRKFWTCVQLAFRLATHLRRLALTLVELKFGRKFFTVWPPSASQHKLIASNLLL